MEDKKYSISEVCDMLNCKPHTLRYIEKVLECEVDRDEFLNRVYSQEQINMLKFIFELKDQGLNYSAIKNILDQQGEIIQDAVEETRKDIVLQEQNLNDFVELLTKRISEEVKESVNSRLEGLTNEIDNLKLQNEQLQLQLHKKQEDHFIEIDNKLMKIREDMKQNNKRSLLERLFKKP